MVLLNDVVKGIVAVLEDIPSLVEFEITLRKSVLVCQEGPLVNQRLRIRVNIAIDHNECKGVGAVFVVVCRNLVIFMFYELVEDKPSSLFDFSTL